MSVWKLSTTLLLCVLSAALLQADKLQVVTSFCLPADWVQQIAGDKVELSVLAGNGQDIHAFDPAPRDMATLAQADLIVEVGAGLEFWLDHMMRSSQTQAQILALSSPLTLRHGDGEEHEAGEEHLGDSDDEDHEEHAHHHHHGEHDPHVWMNPENVRIMSERLTEKLCQLDPANADTYQANMKVWAQKLDAIDQYASQRLNAIPADERVIITYHNNLGYFADRYGISVPATILGSVSTEGGEPSARQMAQLIQLIEHDHVGAVFTDPNSNSRLAAQLCRETGLPAPQPLYVGTFSRSPEGPQDYVELFRYDVDTIADSLQTKPIE